jgi:hypothetical protein
MLKSDLNKILNDRIKFYDNIDSEYNSGIISEKDYDKKLDELDKYESIKKELDIIPDEPNTVNEFLLKYKDVLPNLTSAQIREAKKPVNYNTLEEIYKKYSGVDKPTDDQLKDFISPDKKDSWYNLTGKEYSDLAADLGISVPELSRQLQSVSTAEDRRQFAYYNDNTGNWGSNLLGSLGNMAADIYQPNLTNVLAEGKDYTIKDIAGDILSNASNIIPDLGLAKLNALGRIGGPIAKAIVNTGIQEGMDYTGRRLGDNSDLKTAITSTVGNLGLRAIGPKFVTKMIADLPKAVPIYRESPSGQKISKTIEDIAERNLKSSDELLVDAQKSLNEKEAKWLALAEQDFKKNKFEDIEKYNELNPIAKNRANIEIKLKLIKEMRDGKSANEAINETNQWFKNEFIPNEDVLRLKKGKNKMTDEHAYLVQGKELEDVANANLNEKSNISGTGNINEYFNKLEASVPEVPMTAAKLTPKTDIATKAAIGLGGLGRRNIERIGAQNILPSAIVMKTPEERRKEKETTTIKHDRWSKGFATFKERDSDEYKEFMNAKFKALGRR